MSKAFKILFAAIALVFTAAVAVVVYVVTLDPNEHKDWIAERFREQTGRDLTLGGEIGLTWYPWLGLSLENVAVSNAEGFGDEPFVAADRAVARVKLMPLLQGRYEIDTVRLHGARINLEVDENGRSNWEDLAAGGEEETPEESSGPALTNVVLGGVDIQDAALRYENRQLEVRHEISGFDMSTGELVYGEPIDLNLAFAAASNSPELGADVRLTGTVAYDESGERYAIAPLDLAATLRGPNVPDGGADLTLAAAVQVDLEADTLAVTNLAAEALNSRLEATLAGRGVQSGRPVYEGSLNLAGQDLAVFFRILENQELAQRIAELDSQAYELSTDLALDLDRGSLRVSGLRGNLLGAAIAADVEANNIDSDTPQLRGTVNAAGPDLPTLIEVLGHVQGGREAPLSEAGRQLARVPDKAFLVDARFDADMRQGVIDVPTVNIELLGATVQGNLAATRVNTDTPLIRGALNAAGPDLPLLMQIAGQLQGGRESALNEYGRQLREGVSNRAFSVNAQFDADLQRGDIQVPTLDARMLGFQLNGNLTTRGMSGNDGTVEGALTLTGDNLREVLAAVGQPDLAEVAQSLNLRVGLGGGRRNLAIDPLQLDMVLSGPRIPNSPVTLSLAAGSTVNLDEESLDLDSFRLNGLGLNATGSLQARNILAAPEFSGDLNVDPFDLRALLRQLNQEPPVTADPSALQRVALNTAFSGSASSLSLSALTLGLDETTVQGNVALSEFDNPAIAFDVDVDRLNADRYLAPASEAATTEETPPAQIPGETLRSLRLDGQLDVGSLTISNLDLDSLSLTVDAAGGVLTLVPAASLYEGSFAGELGLDVQGETPALSVQTELTGVALGPLLQDFMDATYLTGKGNVSLALQAAGNDTDQLVRNLNGTGGVELADGVLQGVDVASVLRQVEDMIRQRRLLDVNRGQETPFETFSATLAFNEGAVTSNDLLLDAEGFSVTGRGTLVNLRDDSIAFNLVAMVDEDPATAERSYELGGYDLPIACTGTIASPRCLPDTQEIVRAALSNAVERGVTDLLERALGGERQQQQGQQQPQQQETPPQQNQEEADPAEEVLNRAIENIFRR